MKQYSYDLFGGPYDGGTLSVEWDDITYFTDKGLRFEDHFGFYTIVGFCGYYGVQEHEPGAYPYEEKGDLGIFMGEKNDRPTNRKRI